VAMAKLGNGRLIGIGLYTAPEAAALTRAKRQSITRWLRGYERRGIAHEPLWTPEPDTRSDVLTLSFKDLLQLRTVTAFQKSGLSTRFLRRAILRAEEVLGRERPFATARFRTDGVSILLQVDRDGEEPELENIFTGQREMTRIIERSLRDVEFADMQPLLWRPLGRSGGVVLDPRRSFGAPIEEQTSIPTSALAEAAEAEGSVAAAARLYEIDRRAVDRAMRFETWLAQAA
jgi:uncharacterized protein (DUF433 family)